MMIMVMIMSKSPRDGWNGRRGKNYNRRSRWQTASTARVETMTRRGKTEAGQTNVKLRGRITSNRAIRYQTLI